MGVKREWFRRRPSDAEMREELEAHVAMRAEHDRVDDAAARRRLGNLLHTRESMRRVWIAEWWDALRQDAHFTWRSWRRQPGFALGAILVLALGLGASTALFAALDRILFRSPAYQDPERLVSVGLVLPAPGGATFEAMVDKAYLQVWDTVPPPFESVTATTGGDPCDIVEEQPERATCLGVDFNFLRVLGIRVAAGRDFAPEDGLKGAPRVAIISHALWVRRYGADPLVIGRSLTLDTDTTERVTIAGVLPAAFEPPREDADILLAQQLRPLDAAQPFSRFITAFARLRPDVTADVAERMLGPQLAEVRVVLAGFGDSASWRVRPLREWQFGDSARVAWLLLGAVGVLLMITSVNVANLMLARVAARRREFALRASLGAGRLRLVRLALGEALLLSLTAGALGLLLAFALLKAFGALAPASIPSLADASIDARVFGAAILLAAITGGAIGLWPAFSLLRQGSLQGLRPSHTSPSATPRVRFALVTAQIALTVALLGASALLARSLWNIVSVPLGFDGTQVVTMQVRLTEGGYPSLASRTAFFDELLARVGAMPGTVSATLSDAPAPRGMSLASLAIAVDGEPREPGTRHPPIRIRHVTAQYFETFRIPVIRGRTLVEADRRDGSAILSESAERILFGARTAIGRRVRLSGPDEPWRVVVGVAADVRNGERLTDEPQGELYVAGYRRSEGDSSRTAYLAVRAGGSAVDSSAFLRRMVADLNPRIPVTIETVEQQVAMVTGRERFVASLLSAFAILALLLAGAGLYSVASYLVTQRTSDIGVRMALGASRRHVARQVVGEAGRWIAAGAVLGWAFGWIGSRLLQGQLYGIEALDPWSWTIALLALVMVLAIAVFRPAYRAAHVDPIAALRAD
jgi:predicted permease